MATGIQDISLFNIPPFHDIIKPSKDKIYTHPTLMKGRKHKSELIDEDKGECVSKEWLSTELVKAEKSLRRKETNLDSSKTFDILEDDKKKNKLVKSKRRGMTILYSQFPDSVITLDKLHAKIVTLRLAHNYIQALNVNPSNDNSLYILKSICLELALVILSNTCPPIDLSKIDKYKTCRLSPSTLTYKKTYIGMFERYISIHKHVKAKLILMLRQSLRLSGYPSVKGCEFLWQQFHAFLEISKHPETDKMEQKFNVVVNSTFLLELETVYELVQRHTVVNIHNKQNQSIRCDLIDEFCRPIVQKVRYHFLQSYLGKETKDGQQRMAIRATSMRVDRLPSLLLEYLKELLCHNGIFRIIRYCVGPLIKITTENIDNFITNTITSSIKDGEMRSTATYSNLKYTGIKVNAPCYFLREILQIYRHVLHIHNFFQHPNIVGSLRKCGPTKVRNTNQPIVPLLLSNAMEQILRFDAFVINLLRESNGHVPSSDVFPRLTNILICSYPLLLQCWMELEKVRGISLIHTTAFSSPTLFTPNFDFWNYNSITISPLVEIFLSLINSYREKIRLISTIHFQEEFVAKVFSVICIEYMNILQRNANELRKSLLRCRKNIMNADYELNRNIQRWIEFISGIDLVVVFFRKKYDDNVEAIYIPKVSTFCTNFELESFGLSLEQLHNSMIKEFITIYFEKFLNEGEMLASYVMRCSYMLSSTDICISDEYRNIPFELCKVLNSLSLIMSICHSMVNQILPLGNIIEILVKNNEFNSRKKDNIAECDVRNFFFQSICHASREIISNITQKIEDAFLEVALNVHGTVPHIHIFGANNFQFHVQSIMELFLSYQHSFIWDHISFDRVVDIANLMSTDSSKILSIRNSLRELIKKSNNIYQYLRAENDEFNDKIVLTLFEDNDILMKEGQSIIHSQGFYKITLSDAISVINRRT